MADFTNDLDETLSINCHLLENVDGCYSYMPSTQNFNTLTFNIRSLQKNFDAFQVTLKRFKIALDVIILTECWLNESTIVPQISGYTAFHTKKFINKSGGVVAYVRETWNALVIESSCDDCNCLEICIGRDLLILGIYRSPSFPNVNNFLTSLDKILFASRSKSHIILTGDINLDICSEPLSAQCIDYITLLTEHQLLPAITKPTRNDACLDHHFTKSPKDTLGFICATDITDHYICVVTTKIGKVKPTTSRLRIRVDETAVLEDLKSVDWSSVISSQETNVATDQFNSIIDGIISKNTKNITVSRSKFNLKPWITPGLIRCQKHRDRLHLKAKQYPNNEIIQTSYRRYRNFLINLLRTLKSDYEHQILANNKNNPKKLWESIKDICHLKKTHNHSTDLCNIKSDAVSSLNYCNEYFANVGKNLANKTLVQLSTTEASLAGSVKNQRDIPESFFMTPTDENEVNSLINDLRPNSSPGIDKCTPSLIKRVKHLLMSPLTHIFNLSLSSGTFPNSWKTAIVTPIYKGGDKSVPSNYRPISLLPIFSKLLEKIVNKRTLAYLEKNDLIPTRQFGFRRGKSTEDAVLTVSEIVSEALDKNKYCLGVFIDLAKAFDTVSIPILLQKLDGIGIRGLAHDWFRSYLTDRNQCIRVNLDVSNRLPVEFGVPQGSILGPTLFVLYISDILHLQLKGADIICYADDTAILFQDVSWDSVYETAELGMAAIAEWLRSNLLTLNIDKTKYLAFHKTRVSQPPLSKRLILHTCDTRLTLSKSCSCGKIDRSNKIKYLGVTLDEKFSFKHHISALSGRIRRTAFIMKSLRHSAPRNILIQVYKSLCQSLLIYCIKAWGGAAKSSMLELERAQRTVLKVMTCKHVRFRTDLLYEECRVLRVRQLFVLRAAIHIHKATLSSPDYTRLVKQRIYRIPVPSVRTTFARRHPLFLMPRIYNTVCRNVTIKEISSREAKRVIEAWLLELNYVQTEGLLDWIR